MKSIKSYILPDSSKLLPCTEEIYKYLNARALSNNTIDAFQIGSDDQGNMVFPFYRNGILTYVKYRKPCAYTKDSKTPKEWAMSNTEPILFGMDKTSFSQPLVITEGQIDAMSLYEAGVTNVVSVPSGCNNMDFVQLCWDWLERFSEIILFGDNDEPGVAMMNNLMNRLGEDRCVIVTDYPQLVYNDKDYDRQCKDANEILRAYGPEFLAEMVEDARPTMAKGVLNLADVPFIDPTTQPRVYTRVPALDTMLGGLGEGSITVFSGKRGCGKSTLTGQILLNAVDQGYKVAAYSGELSSYKFLEWIMSQATERQYIDTKYDARSGKMLTAIHPVIQGRIKQWLNGKFYLFDNAAVEDGDVASAIIRVFTTCARRYGVKVFLVDNLMSALVGTEDEIKAQAQFTAALKAFATKFKVAVLLVAHPRKTKANEAFTSDDVSGSAVITNLADNVISVEKPNLRVTKNRDFGECGCIQCSFDPSNRRIFQTNTGDRTIYSWNHDDLPMPENPASQMKAFEISVGAAVEPV